MRDWDAARVAEAAGARLLEGTGGAQERSGPCRAGIDSRAVSAGELFVGLRGQRADGGEHAAEALRSGAWGVLVSPEHAAAAVVLAGETGAAVLARRDPLKGLQALARAWRSELAAHGAKVVAITGSTGKTSTKDILAALVSAQRRVLASPENFNTEIGLPLALLAAPAGTEVLVLEMAMRGPGQIAELTAIAEPDVGVIVNVGPVHLELLGSLEAVAAAKAELIYGLAPGATVVVPAYEPLLAPHLRADLSTITFGDGGDVALQVARPDGELVIGAAGGALSLRPSFRQAHNVQNLLAAVAASVSLGLERGGELNVHFSALRGERLALSGGVTLINDCYNANPMSMRAAIDDLAETSPARRVAVLGDMLELGPDGPLLHRELGAYAAARGVELLVTVGPLAAEMRASFAGDAHAVTDAAGAAALLARVLREGDTVLVKGSRGVELELVAQALEAVPRESREHTAKAPLTPAAGPRRR
jgi:UDP-N-acetylmuramoyl-tripeptide--D-alanyl-D-alanine ligase